MLSKHYNNTTSCGVEEMMSILRIIKMYYVETRKLNLKEDILLLNIIPLLSCFTQFYVKFL